MLRRFSIQGGLLALFVMFCMSAQAVVVTPTNPQGWTAANVRPGGSVAITCDQPNNGLGSLRFDTADATAKADFEITDLTGGFGLLADLTSLSYDWYRDSSSTAAAHLGPVLRLYVYDPETGHTGLLIYEQAYNNGTTAVPTDQWVSDDVTGAYFWQRKYNPGQTIEVYNNTLSDWLDPTTEYNFGENTIILGINVGVGSGWTGTFTGYVDNVSMTVGGVTFDYNFEPDECEPVIPEPATIGLLSLGLGLFGVSRRRRRA